MKYILAASALAVLAGCVTPGPQVQQSARPTARDDPSNGCFASIAYDARFVALREKITINMPPQQATLEMLADRTTPTPEEKKLLSTWLETRKHCASTGEAFRAQYAPPEYIAITNSNQTVVANLTARLYTGEITYGEFNRLRADNSVQAQARGAAADQRGRDTQAAIAAQEEDRRRQAIGAALQNMQAQQQINQQNALQQQQIMNQNRPRQTNCQRIGNQMNCTTY